MKSCLDCNAELADRRKRCEPCALRAKRAATAAWHKAHPDWVREKNRKQAEKRKADPAKDQAARAHHREYHKKYYQRNRARILERTKARVAAMTPEERRAREMRWIEANRDKKRAAYQRFDQSHKELRREQRARRYYRDPQRSLDSWNAWAKANPEKLRLIHNRRRARLLDQRSPGVTVEQWAVVCAAFQDSAGGTKCAYCDAPATTIDHVVPISRGGLDAYGNVVPACRPCNSSKRDRLLSEWRGRKKAA